MPSSIVEFSTGRRVLSAVTVLVVREGFFLLLTGVDRLRVLSVFRLG
jgi:hypothetical protein